MLLCDCTGREKLAVFDLISRLSPIWVRGRLLLEQPPVATGRRWTIMDSWGFQHDSHGAKAVN